MNATADYEDLARRARNNADYAIGRGDPVSAREWIETAAAADRAGRHGPEVMSDEAARKILEALSPLFDGDPPPGSLEPVLEGEGSEQ